MGSADLSTQWHTTGRLLSGCGHLPFGPSFIFPLGGAKSGQKTACNVETTNKEIQINREHCNLGNKERGNISHPIEFYSLLIQFWAFPVWELK